MIQRSAIVLLGMHRSGTSLSMSMLSSLGVDCGNSLIPAGTGNEEGFWEHSGIVSAHERLLASLGRVWHGPKGTYPFPEGWLNGRAGQRAQERLNAIVSHEMASANGVWGFKDPRTARLLPLWDRVFSEAGVNPIYILAIRHPWTVVHSLAKHNGMEPARAALVWVQYNLDAVCGAGERLAMVCDYDRIIEDPAREVERMAGAIGPVISPKATQIDDAIDRVKPSMKRSSPRPADHCAIALEVYNGLLEMAKGQPMPTSLDRLMKLYFEFEDLFAEWRKTKSPLAIDWAIRGMTRQKFR